MKTKGTLNFVEISFADAPKAPAFRCITLRSPGAIVQAVTMSRESKDPLTRRLRRDLHLFAKQCLFSNN